MMMMAAEIEIEAREVNLAHIVVTLFDSSDEVSVAMMNLEVVTAAASLAVVRTDVHWPLALDSAPPTTTDADAAADFCLGPCYSVFGLSRPSLQGLCWMGGGSWTSSSSLSLAFYPERQSVATSSSLFLGKRE